jgi:hypothetical protein
VDLCRDIIVNIVVDGCAGSRVREEFKYQYKSVITPSQSYAFTGGSVVAVIKMKGRGGQPCGRSLDTNNSREENRHMARHVVCFIAICGWRLPPNQIIYIPNLPSRQENPITPKTLRAS